MIRNFTLYLGRLPFQLRQFSSFKDSFNKFSRPLWVSFAGISCLTAAITTYMNREITEMNNRVKVAQTGKVDIGGDFNLINQNGEKCNLGSFAGKWIILYFGFCRCPDICPEQLERLVEVVERVHILNKNLKLVPVFVTVDPERDSPEVVKKYIADFSDKLVGLTGSIDEIKSVCKNYRIYYSAGRKDDDGDYIVDHTVVMYLMNPEGEFEQYYGQLKPIPDVVRDIVKRANEYDKKFNS